MDWRRASRLKACGDCSGVGNVLTDRLRIFRDFNINDTDLYLSGTVAERTSPSSSTNTHITTKCRNTMQAAHMATDIDVSREC